MPNTTVVKRLCTGDCECSNHRSETYIGLNALSGKDVEREKKRRAKRSNIKKVELIS